MVTSPVPPESEAILHLNLPIDYDVYFPGWWGEGGRGECTPGVHTCTRTLDGVGGNAVLLFETEFNLVDGDRHNMFFLAVSVAISVSFCAFSHSQILRTRRKSHFDII